MTTIAQSSQNYNPPTHTAAALAVRAPQFSSNGWPINPATGREYSRAEIVSDPAIPYPQHVDPTNPGPYWQRRSPAEVDAEQKRIARKSQVRNTRRGKRSGYAQMQAVLGRATLELVERVNRPDEGEVRFVNGFAEVW
jgi:hypothetical protein